MTSFVKLESLIPAVFLLSPSQDSWNLFHNPAYSRCPLGQASLLLPYQQNSSSFGCPAAHTFVQELVIKVVKKLHWIFSKISLGFSEQISKHAKLLYLMKRKLACSPVNRALVYPHIFLFCDTRKLNQHSSILQNGSDTVFLHVTTFL